MSREQYVSLLEDVLTEAKNLRRLINRDDHWCMEDCHKCKARDAFDLALHRLEKCKVKREQVLSEIP